MEIADDFSVAWLVEHYGLYNGQAGKCIEEQYPPGSISSDSLTVAAPHTEQPGESAQPPPQGPTTTAPTVSGPNSPTVPRPQSPPRRCRSGYTWARISSHATCLHEGESCSWRYRRQYHRYHFACVRKGTHYRLVRRR
jgi:hypothetical protein